MAASSSPIAVAHYCEGAGHATRMLAVATALEDAGREVVLAGGGPGQQFLECNGFESVQPTPVNFIEGYQRGARRDVLTESISAVLGRIRDFLDWLREVEPAYLVTDDIFAAVAATVCNLDYYFISHDPASFYETVPERIGAKLRHAFAKATAELFVLPKAWTGEPMIAGTRAVPPIAQPTNIMADGVGAVDVLVVPSAYTTDESRLRGAIEDAGRSVTLVGDADWETKPSLQPYIEAANVVVCSGYSTVMEAAVAGTRCIVLPYTSEQRGVARAVAERPGFYDARSVEAAVALLDRVDAPDSRANGATVIAEQIMDDAAV